MKNKGIFTAVFFVLSFVLFAQHEGEKPQGAKGNYQKIGALDTVAHKVLAWRLMDDFSLVDTAEVDTLHSGFQIYNPVYRETFSSVYLSNMGTAYRSNILSGLSESEDFTFGNHLGIYLPDAKNLRYYNVRTPYTNLTYFYGGPKTKSEETVRVLHTQNITPKWNVGMRYNLISSIGRYGAQKADNRNFQLFSSYRGQNYTIHGAFMYNKLENFEGGGIIDDDFVRLDTGIVSFEQEENINVFFYDAKNKIENYQLFVAQSLGLGQLKFLKPDSTMEQLPIGTAYHSFELNTNKRRYGIDNINWEEGDIKRDFYPSVFVDSLVTRDSARYNVLRNTFQLKFNEEANRRLNFGLRVFITNEVEQFAGLDSSRFLVDEEGISQTTYWSSTKTEISNIVGGQMFKNIGQNFWWNAGAKLYFTGYKVGDLKAYGGFNSSFRLFNDTAGVFANGEFQLKRPTYFETEYHSNHFDWYHPEYEDVKQKIIKVKGGVRVPTRNLMLSGEARLLSKYLYYDVNAMPQLTDDEVITLYMLRLDKVFKFGNFRSINHAVYQESSDQTVVPLPRVAVGSSLLYQNVLAKVLFFQIGVDLKFHTKYYTPRYMPATGQFYAQDPATGREIGEYPFLDVFVNFQLKRARFFLKYDHVNQGWPTKDYFLTTGYPYNPRGLRFGLSWNFYD